MYAIVYMFSHQFQVPFFITDYLSVLVPYIFTSFSNASWHIPYEHRFQYHTFLHHSQTPVDTVTVESVFQYHTFSHHSQTCRNVLYRLKNFSTIRFYIILKRVQEQQRLHRRFSTIRFYIILKQRSRRRKHQCVSVPYVFTSFSNRGSGFLGDLVVSVPYVFTSFSNRIVRDNVNHSFQYHTFLHHSQTVEVNDISQPSFQYHTFLHHSQTVLGVH